MQLRRHDGERVELDVPAGEGAYSCEGPVERLIQIAAGEDVSNDSPGHVAARSVELLEAIHLSAHHSGAPTSINLALGAEFAPAARRPESGS